MNRLFAPLADDLEEEDGCCCGDVEGADLAGQGDGQDLVARLADERPEALALGAEDDADGAGVVERIPGLVPGAFGADEPEALVLELFHGPDEIRDPGDEEVFEGPGRDRVDGLGQAGRAPLGQDEAVDPRPFGATDDSAQVLGVIDLVENDDEGLGRASQDVIERGITLGGNFGHDTLVAWRDLVETAGRDEDAGDMPGLGLADDLSDPGVALLFLDEDLVDPSGRGLEGLEEGVDPDDPVHGRFPGHYKAIGRRVPDLLFHPDASGKMASVKPLEAGHAG